MDLNVSDIVNVLRPLSSEIFSGKSIISLSTDYLKKLNQFTEIIDTSFQSFHIADSKTNRNRDIQFIQSLFQKAVNLKVYPDILSDSSPIKITHFANLKTLEITKIDVNLLFGLQKLRSQLQELICCSSLEQFSTVLMKCGGDNSQPYSWNELKKARFSYNNITEMDNSFDWTLSLHSLDISHNKLTTVNLINQLPNLKYLNISYNRLTHIPDFKGPSCYRLQILILNNNFIEDLSGLTSLINIVHLDLNQNSLIDHNVLLSTSHLISLQYLNLQNNPLSFHQKHRHLSSSYLNKNAKSLKFLLDGIQLTKLEKGNVGSYYPVNAMSSNNLYNQDRNSLINSLQEKSKKIRNVKIGEIEDNFTQIVLPKFTPSPSNEHLRLKKHIEQLREEHGELWLHKHSGVDVHDVLGFEKSLLSSTPIEHNRFHMSDGTTNKSETTNYENVNTTCTTHANDSIDEFKTANDFIIGSSQQSDYSSDSSDGEDVFTSGEECIYLVTNKNDQTQVSIVVTEKFISERDVTNSKEKARWHVNTIVKCEKENGNSVKLEFNTVRRDRKLRLYELDPVELETFYIAVTEKIDLKKIDEEKKLYQCMKCSNHFKKNVENTLLSVTIECPACNSNLVIES